MDIFSVVVLAVLWVVVLVAGKERGTVVETETLMAVRLVVMMESMKAVT